MKKAMPKGPARGGKDAEVNPATEKAKGNLPPWLKRAPTKKGR